MNDIDLKELRRLAEAAQAHEGISFMAPVATVLPLLDRLERAEADVQRLDDAFRDAGLVWGERIVVAKAERNAAYREIARFDDPDWFGDKSVWAAARAFVETEGRDNG